MNLPSTEKIRKTEKIQCGPPSGGAHILIPQWMPETAGNNRFYICTIFFHVHAGIS